MSGWLDQRYLQAALAMRSQVGLLVSVYKTYTAFSFFVFKFANKKRIPFLFFAFKFTNEKLIPFSFFVFKSEVRKTNSFFVCAFRKLRPHCHFG